MIGDSRLLPFRHQIDIFSYYQMKKRYLWKGSIIEQQIYQQQKIQFFLYQQQQLLLTKRKSKISYWSFSPLPPFLFFMI